MKIRFGAWLLALVLIAAAAFVVFRGGRPSQRVDPDQSAEAANRVSAGTGRHITGSVRTALTNSAQSQNQVVATLVSPASQVSLTNPGSTRPAHPASRPWDTTFFDKLREAGVGDPISFDLVGGLRATGVIRHLEYGADNEVVHVAGDLSQPEQGHFFFQRQTAPGVAGAYVGVVEFPATQKAYRLEPSDQGTLLVERPLGEVRCLRLPRAGEALQEQNSEPDPEQIPPLKPAEFPTVPIPPYQNGIVILESLPGATAVIYLDFQGGYTPTWGGIEYQKPNVSNSQIRDVWVRVAEDYMPFGINVTTDLTVFQNAPERSRQRVIITPTNTAEPGAGGVAYIGSFNWTGDTPCWVFMTSGKNCAEAASHEAGHTLGLSHDGRDVNGVHTEYYDGHGTGDLAWAPIMGTGYSRNVSQWSKGEYANASNTQDDLSILSTKNNDVAYRVDDTGEGLDGARYLEIKDDYTVIGQGVIERTGDIDAFRFTTSGGAVSLRADPVGVGPDLALEVSLQDSAGSTWMTTRPTGTLWASLSTNLPAGTYVFSVAGSGRNTVNDGFSSYASLGFYALSGTVANARRPDRFALAENTPAGATVGIIAVNNPDRHQLQFQITSGNDAGVFAIDSAGQLTVANAAPLDYEVLAKDTQMPVQFELFLDVLDLTDGSLTENARRVVVSISNLNEPPVVADSAVSMLERTLAGTPITTVAASDPDFYTLLSFSIAAGNADRLFSINPQSGLLSCARDVTAADVGSRQLRIAVSDQASPNPLIVTSLVEVSILPNSSLLQPGKITYTAYTNLPGSTMSSFLSSPRFPYEPSFEKNLTSLEADANWADRYGAAMRGYLIPPASGAYTFWVASDDGSQLWLSTSTNPAAISQIASVTDGNWTSPREWDRFASQKSRAITLVAGQPYYIEARLRESTGNDHLAVAWECASAGISREVIPGRFLVPYSMNYTPRPVGTNLSVHRNTIEHSRLTDVRVLDANQADTHQLSIVAGNNAGIFSLDAVTGVLRVANETALQAATQTSFNLTIQAVDNGSPSRSGTANIAVSIVETNTVTAKTPYQELFYSVGSGTAISDLTNKSKFPKRPDELRPLSAFQGGQGLADNYGSRIRALLIPPTSGTHYFFIASDDSSSLRFSSTGDPAAATQLASVSGSTSALQWNKYSSQRSQPVTLSSGRKVYVEVLHKEGGGDDHVAVGWVRPGINTTNIIPVTQLQPVDLNYAPELSGRLVSLPLSATNGAAVTTLAALDSPVDTITYKIVSGNEGGAFQIDPDSGAITVADNKIFATYVVSDFILTVQAQDSGYGGLFPRQSAFATVHILITDNTPTFVWQGTGADDTWSIAQNWSALPSERAKLTFSGTVRQTSRNDLLASVGRVTLLNSGFYLSGNPLVLLAGLSSAGDNTWAINSTLNSPQSIQNLSGTLSFSGDLDNDGHDLLLETQDTVALSGRLSGTGSLTKRGAGTLWLGSANTLSGPVKVESGWLVLARPRSLGDCTSLELAPDATLDVREAPAPFAFPDNLVLFGEGRVEGAVEVPGVLAPGNPVGALTFDGGLKLSGRTEIDLQKLDSGLSNDIVRVLGDLRLGGELVVRTTGLPLSAGDSFRVFEAARFGAAFDQLTLPPLPGGLRWHTDRLSTDGVLAVTAVAPAILPVSVGPAGGLVIEFQGVPGLNYELQVSDSLSEGGSWSTLGSYPGAEGTTSLELPIDTEQPSRFYRLRVSP